MDAQARSPRRLVSRLTLLAVGLALGAGLVTAHFTGRLTPLYHRLGLHALHGTAEQPEGGGPQASGAHAGHAGHGGMSMPQAGGGEPSKIPGYSTVQVSPERQQIIGVRTGKVTRDRLLMSIRAVGIIEPDQTRLARVHTRISGWVTKVHVNFVGQNVQRGDPLLEIYSPDLLATQEEYLNALDGGQKSLAALAGRRLELWGVPAGEVRELERTRRPRETLTLPSPIRGRVLERNVLEGTYVEPATELYRIADLSVVWLQAKIYEYELPHIEIGQPVRIVLASQPETEIAGKVSFVEPVLQETTRTVKVRVEIKNPEDQFKPGMYADLVIEHDMGEGLLVPEAAVLRTGVRDLAFRVLPGNRFEPVEVKLGSQFNERFQVLAGLSEGDEIVTSAGFLIDAESRLKSATSAMGGHQHGGSAAPPPGSPPPPAPKPGEEKKSGAGHEHHHHEE
jgi:Cu(I)/Ag(I) efflux system membrane fusion protein